MRGEVVADGGIAGRRGVGRNRTEIRGGVLDRRLVDGPTRNWQAARGGGGRVQEMHGMVPSCVSVACRWGRVYGWGVMWAAKAASKIGPWASKVALTAGSVDFSGAAGPVVLIGVLQEGLV